MKNRCRQRTKSSCTSTTYIISDLPNSILENILMLLPMKDAARTSILSRKWRYIWAKLPQLIFDDTTCAKESPQNQQASKDKLLLTIYQVLLLHCAPIIKFTLSLSGLEGCLEIDQIILFLSRNGIEDFTLHIRRGERYKLPIHLFSCKQLKHLNLHCCEFQPPPTFRGFTKLTRLKLREVTFAADVIGSFISSCPLLEQLTLESFTTTDSLEINAPKLKFLHIRGIFKTIHFQNTPLLANVSVDAHMLVDDESHMVGSSSYVIEVFNCLPSVEYLHMGYTFFVKLLAAGKVPNRLPTTLNHLKCLHIMEICLRELDEVSFALCLIRSSPNLEQIIFQFAELDSKSNANEEHVLEFLEAEDHSDVSLNQLRELQMLDVTGVTPELKFIKFLLAISPKLKWILVKPVPDTNVNRGFQLLKSLARFERASPKSQLIYVDP